MIKDLRNYDFPDKKDFMTELDEFNKLRITYIHRLLSTNPDAIVSKIDKDLANLKNLAESLLIRYDNLVKGVTSSWFVYLEKVRNETASDIPIEELEKESPIGSKKGKSDASSK